MVDYNFNVPTVQPMQQPNMMQAYGQMQQIQANRMMMEERARALQEQNALRALLAGGVKVGTPEFTEGAARISPELGLRAETSRLANVREQRTAEAQQAQAENARVQSMRTLGQLGADKIENYRNSIARIDPTDRVGYAELYKIASPEFNRIGAPLPTPEMWNAETQSRVLQTGASVLEMLKEDAAAARERAKYKVGKIGGRDVRYRESDGPAEEILVREAPATRFGGLGQSTGLPNVVGTVPVGPGAAAPGDAQAVTNNMRAAPAQNVNALAGRTVPASQLAAESEANKQKQELEKERLKALQDPAKQLALRKEVGEAKKETESAIGTLNTALKSVNKIKAFSDEDLNRELGYVGANTPAVSAQSKAVRTAFNELKGTATAMAKADAGKIGSMQVQEWGILRDQLTDLNFATMTTKELREQVERVESRADTLIDQAKRNYSETYGSTAKELGGFSEVFEGRKSVGITQAEYNALPSGSTYTDPNGNVRTKR
jgi:hypothetical protein